MARVKPAWGRIRHAYVCGDMSYRELAKKFDVSFKRLSEVAKKEKWPTKRRQYRDEVGARAYARARDEAVDQLEAVRHAADRLGGKLDEIMADEKQLFMHTAVLMCEDGSTELCERRMDAVNPQTLVALTRAMKEMTAVLRNLHGISTRAEDRAEDLAQARLEIERERLTLEKEKAGADGGDRKIEVVFADAAAEEMAD